MSNKRVAAVLVLVLLLTTLADAQQPEQGAVRQEMVGVGITEKLGNQLPLDAVFTDHTGKSVRLGDYFQAGRPVVLSLVYYQCPGLCTASLSGLTAALQDVEWTPGEKYHVVTVSFNPKEGPDLAKIKRDNYLAMLGRPEAAEGWTFLTGDESNIERLTEAVGFRYTWVEGSGQYAHDAAAIILTPQGRVSRYLRGAYYDPETFRLSLVEASNGEIGSLSDQVWMRVCGYDAAQGKYVVMAKSILAAGGVLTLGTLALVLSYFFYHEHKQRKKASASDVQPHAV